MYVRSFASGPRKSKKDILIYNIMDIRPQFSLSQLSRLDLPTLHIIYEDIKLIHSVQPKLTERGKYIADILRFAVRVSSLELNRLPTDDLKYISTSFWNMNKEITEYQICNCMQLYMIESASLCFIHGFRFFGISTTIVIIVK